MSRWCSVVAVVLSLLAAAQTALAATSTAVLTVDGMT
jgi:hypothetical protein